jgi:uroporphyrinogen-III synthase
MAMKIAITRLKDKAARDPALCRSYGHECYAVSPLASAVYPERVEEFVACVNRGEFDCLFFTSALPAQIIAPLLERWPRVIAIGPQTKATLEGLGVSSEMLPSHYSRDFAPYLGDWLDGRSVGIPRADVPNEALLEAIRQRGGTPCEYRIYGLVPTGEELALDDADAILFTSAGSFDHAVWTPRPGMMLVAIGEITGDRMEQAGFLPAVVGDGSLAGTLAALNRHLRQDGGGADRMTTER